MHAATSPKSYRQDIDGLRAIAVLLVLIFHFSLVPAITAGFTGVDVFFVISGFLITGILHRQLDRSEFTFAGFYTGRIRRLAPALVTTLLATFIAGLCILFPNDLRELANQMLAAQAYVANIYFWQTVNYFGLNGENVFLLHTWSLAVEEQFYLLYPIALLLLHRYARRWFWHGVAGFFVISLLLNLGFVARKPEAVFYLLPTRAWELLAGALTVLAMDKVQASRMVKQVSGALGLLLIALGALLYKPEYRFPGAFALIPVLGTALVLFSHDTRATLVARFLALAPMRYAGRISYPLYLVHWPIHVFAARLLGTDYGYGAHTVMFGLSVVAAAAIYHFVESPIRDGKWFARRGPLLAGYAVALAATVVAAAADKVTHGFPTRFPPEVSRLAGFVNDKTPPLTECEFDSKQGELRPERLCRVGSATATPRWIVAGDSHAWATHDAFDLWLKSRNEAGLFIFRHGCPPLAAVHMFGDDGTCFRFNNAVATFAERTTSIDSIALVSTWRQGRERLISSSERLRPTDESSRLLFAQGLSAEVDRLIAAGKHVYVWEPLPGAKAKVPVTLAQAALHGVAPDLDKTRDEYSHEYDFFFDALTPLRPRLAGVFSPAETLCSTGSCVTSANGSPLYFDSSHPTRTSAAYFAHVLANGR